MNQSTVRVYDLSCERHVDARASYALNEGGLFQHSKDQRPDLPQVKVMQAVLDPLGMPLATDVVSGQQMTRSICLVSSAAQLLATKMAARGTRAALAVTAPGSTDGELDAGLEPVWRGRFESRQEGSLL